MKRNLIRSALFNLLFYGFSAMVSTLCIPGLLLPRSGIMIIVRFYLKCVTALEYCVLGLKYEVRGVEHLPADGPYIIAAKHQSPYETLKLYSLFGDPAIILKKELTKIPLWGAFLRKTGAIAIDRSSPKLAMASIKTEALRIKEEGRPIVIFPQGTRVWPHETARDKPYKSGLGRIYEATNLPIIPMATNSGMFWPRSGFLKSSGTVVFEFLPLIGPGQPKETIMKKVEEDIESATEKLMEEALERNTSTNNKAWLLASLSMLAVLFAGYSYLWFETAQTVSGKYLQFMHDMGGVEKEYTTPLISGFPGPINIRVPEDELISPEGMLRFTDLNLRGWPIPGVPFTLDSGPLTIHYASWPAPLVFDSLRSKLSYKNQILSIHEAQLLHGDFQAGGKGTVDMRQEPVPLFDVVLSLVNQEAFLADLAEKGFIKPREAMFMAAGLNNFKKDGAVQVPIHQKGRTLFAGPLPITILPAPAPPGQVLRGPETLRVQDP